MHFEYQHIQSFFHLVRESHIKPGAYRLQRLLGRNHFHTTLLIPSILVGGTNGKGTTCAFLESILRHSGLKTGLYTSPHLVSPTERIRISGIPVSEKEILDTLKKLDINRKLFLPDATFFECMTATALLLFYEKNVDVIICEVGLGGRYDSTNIINPIMSVLTGVSLEHTQILGKTIAKIAGDKAYIGRRNKPFVVNADIPQSAYHAVCKTAKLLGSDMILTSQKLTKSIEQNFFEHSSHIARKNLRTALTVIDCITQKYQNFNKFRQITNDTIRLGIENMWWPGRFDIREIQGKTVIFDCAHNPGGVEFFLKQYEKSKFAKSKFDLIFASLEDKNWKTNISLLSHFAKSVTIVPFDNERAQNPDNIFTYLKTTFPNLNTSLGSNIKNSIDKLFNSNSKAPILVTGSIAFVGAAFESFNINVFPT